LDDLDDPVPSTAGERIGAAVAAKVSLKAGENRRIVFAWLGICRRSILAWGVLGIRAIPSSMARRVKPHLNLPVMPSWIIPHGKKPLIIGSRRFLQTSVCLFGTRQRFSTSYTTWRTAAHFGGIPQAKRVALKT